MLFSDDEFEEPVDVFYQRWSKLVDHMLADPDLNMYLCVIQYPFAGSARLKEAPDLIPKWKLIQLLGKHGSAGGW